MFAEILRQRLEGIVSPDERQVELLRQHYELLLRWNRVLNLTSVDSMEEAVERHYGESLFLGAHLGREAARIADIGAGAGFPGVPIAILRPDCSLVLIEAHSRKAVFLREATRQLPNVRVLNRRAEVVEESFDWAISRAVSYRDLALILKIGRRAGLLTGAEGPPAEFRFEWQDPIPLPWGRQRFLRIGVSRET